MPNNEGSVLDHWGDQISSILKDFDIFKKYFKNFKKTYLKKKSDIKIQHFYFWIIIFIFTDIQIVYFVVRSMYISF